MSGIPAAAPTSPDQENNNTNDTQQPPPHPSLKTPSLHFSGPTKAVPDEAIVSLLSECLRVRLTSSNLDSSDSSFAPRSGKIEFEHLIGAERAYATVNHVSIPDHPNCNLDLFISDEKNQDQEPKPSARPRLVKQVPSDITPGKLFDAFRPFGPLHKVTFQYASTPSGPSFKGLAVLEYYDEDHASNAEREMHCADLDGSTLTVQVYEPKRGPISGLGIPPGGGPQGRSVSTTNTPTRRPSSHQYPQQTRSFSGGLSPTAGTMVDPCNLFIKNLHSSVTSGDLFHAFRSFGYITSAHVMRDEHTKVSKEFGFVSFSDPEAAAKALHAMDNKPLTSNSSGKSSNITVNFHEPKRYREPRLAKSHGSPSTTSPPTSPNTSIDQVSLSLHETTLQRNASTSSNSSSQNSSTPNNNNNTSASASASAGGGSSANEKERLLAGVEKLGLSNSSDIVDLLLSLPKKDRALCLFNVDVLKAKAHEAQQILESTADTAPTMTAITSTTTPVKSTSSTSSSTSSYTLESLAKMPASEIIRLASDPSKRPEQLLEPDNAKVDEMDNFMDSLREKPAHEQKQKLGDKIFKAIKGFGIKGAPQITIHLLDSEDLRSLAHLMAEQPQILEEKAKRVQPKSAATPSPAKK